MKKADSQRLENYERATATTLREIYTSWSSAKQIAYDNIIRDMVNIGGFNLKVFNPNTFGYSAGFMWIDAFGQRWLEYYTKDNTYSIKIDE